MTNLRRPLRGITICELMDGPLAPATRYLAELGARVIHFAAAPQPVLDSNEALTSFAWNHGKEWCVADPATAVGRASIEVLFAEAHAIVVDRSHGAGMIEGFDAATLRTKFPDAVVVEASNFGSGNDFSGWQATTPVLLAMSGSLSRSGIRGKPPLFPPGDLGFECSALQLAWVILLGLTRRLQTGTGEAVDFSALDGAMQALDPGYGISGSATLGKPAKELAPGRPPRGFQYPILACADGAVRICLLAKRQWRGMFEWMGSPEEFASPEFDSTSYRYKSPALLPALAKFFAPQTRAQLEAGAKTFGVPLSGLYSGEESLDAEHFKVRQAFAEAKGPGDCAVALPNGVLEIDGERMVADSGPFDGNPRAPDACDPTLPLSGIKVLDLGVIVVGGEQARLLADAGADVVKVESRAFPDGSRQSYMPIPFSISFAAGHRNKRSLGLNLRDTQGLKLFEQLVAKADVVLTNFKPGTMESLGLSYERLRELNANIVLVESSAFGKSGPWAKRMGYGPLVRAATGLTTQWRYPDEPDGYSDSTTIYPDHVGGRVSAIGALAMLLDRASTARGGLVTTSQAEIVFSHQAWRIAAAKAGRADPYADADVPWGVYPAAGDDQWVVVTARGDADWHALCGIVAGLDATLDREGRLAAKEVIEAALTTWTSARSPGRAAAELQAVGVPCGPMLRVSELPDHAYFRQREIFRKVTHRNLPEPYWTEAMHACFESLAPPPERPAPLPGEQTAEIMRDWLGLSDEQIANHVAQGVLEPLDPAVAEQAEQLRNVWAAERSGGRNTEPD